MNIARRWVLTAVLAGSMVGGGVGAAVMNATSSSAATGNGSTATTTATASKSTSTAATPTAAAPSGTFKPNENASHESGESAQREAQEDAGQFPTVP
jgi:hypothetical protein